MIEVCIPELVLNETRQDKTGPHFPNCWYRDKTTVFWSRHSRKSGKNPGNKLIFIREVFGNSLMFPDLKRDLETASPECRYWVGTGKRMFSNARDGKFPWLFGKNPVPGKWHSRLQTSSIWVVGPFDKCNNLQQSPVLCSHLLPHQHQH